MRVGPRLTLTPTTAPLGFDLLTTVTALLTMALLTMALLTMALLTMALLTMALLTMALPTVVLLTMALLTMALLTMALLTMAHHGNGAYAGAWSAERGPQRLGQG